MADELTHAYDIITGRLVRGKVVPVLGAGANLWERPPPSFQRGICLPSGQELADELARSLGDDVETNGRDLARVSQYVAALLGEGSLEDELRDVFGADCPPTDLHRFLARLARRVRQAEDTRECMLIVTTNYDNLLERAFADEGEPYELVTYIAQSRDRGMFRHITADGESTVIRKPNEYVDFRLDRQTVIAKVHGSVDRVHGDSFVITEDHYIDYLTRADVAGLFPVTLAAKLRTSHFLFLGYSLRDWNLRVMLYRLWGEQEGKHYKSWAIQKDPDPIDEAAWKDRGVDILPVSVEDFVAAVEQRLSTRYIEQGFPAQRLPTENTEQRLPT
jgi:SIR2-like protein